MAQSNLVTVTATKIVRKNQSQVSFPSGKDITVNLTQARILPNGASNLDSIIILPDNTQIYAEMAFATLNTALSATQETGS